MALVDLIRKRDTKTAIATSAISATSLATGDSPVAGVATVAIAHKYRTREKNAAPMSMRETQTLLDWLVRIGETDQDVIDYVLRDCRSDIEKRTFFLNLVAEEVG
ncbi:hypothetical protein [Massilia pinisoli]|uniref:hypothetical protein n=1 Tax=Massilia pinisoli TaxID=1772194 RepID=UPI0036D218D9